MGAGAIVEEIAQQNAARPLIGLDANKTTKGRVRRMRAVSVSWRLMLCGWI